LTTAPCGSVVADCSLYSHGDLIHPWHPYSHDSQTPLAPGTPTALEVEIFPTTAVIEPGHSLRLTIATGHFPHETAPLSTTSDAGPMVRPIHIDRHLDRPLVCGACVEAARVRVADDRTVALADEPWRVLENGPDAARDLLDRRRLRLERDRGLAHVRRVDRLH